MGEVVNLCLGESVAGSNTSQLDATLLCSVIVATIRLSKEVTMFVIIAIT